MPSFARSALKLAAWSGFLAGTVLILSNSFTDFRPGGERIFIGQRSAMAGNPLWLFSLNLHVLSGSICLLSSLPLLSGRLLRRIPSLHRVCGRIYAASVLLVLCPTGIHLAFSAKGGAAGQGGFLLLGIATFITTLLGVTAIAGRDLLRHRRWMTRSFALVATAVTFRIHHIVFFHAGLPDEVNYLASLWLSILGNAAVAEWILHRRPEFRNLTNSVPSIP